MLTVLGGIILGAAAGVLAGMIISFVVLGISHLVDRIKRWHKGTAVFAEAGKTIAEAIEAELKKNGGKLTSIDALKKWENVKKVLGENSVIEAHADEYRKVNPEDVHILKAERIEEPLKRFLKENKGLAQVACEQ